MLSRELLKDFYGIDTGEKIIIAGREGYLSNGMIYFIMNALNFETIHMEQATLAYYLLENGWHHVAVPIQNEQGEWFTNKDNGRYIIFQVSQRQIEKESTGTTLATFHSYGSNYPFEPNTISSYGQWKKLWVEKITVFEENLTKIVTEDPGEEKKLMMSLLPYIIGMSENAVQYLRETEESELRYSDKDQGSIAFHRFIQHTDREVIWPDQFVYDHPSRDIAEHIRFLYLSDYSDEAVFSFISDYQQVRPLSFFSWQLIYARLIFPIHLFDAVEDSVQSGEIESLRGLLDKQEQYEMRLQHFFGKVGLDKEAANLMELEWLSNL